MLFDSLAYIAIFTGLFCKLATPYPLQFRELVDHLGFQVGFTEPRCSVCYFRQLRRYLFCYVTGKTDDPFDLLADGSELLLVNNAI